MAIFDEWVHKGRAFLHDFEEEAGLEKHTDDRKALRILKAILHTLRERLVPTESKDFMSELPMIFKAIYADWWDFSRAPVKIRHKQEFLERIMNDPALSNGDINSLEEAEKYFKAFIRLLIKEIGTWEIQDILGQLPEDIREMVEDVVNQC